jgi:SAM-dependent methyltransferase
MKNCLICGRGPLEPLLDFGPQPLCNRFLQRADDAEERFELALGQCAGCGLIQILSPVAPKELKPRFDWLVYNEKEMHLDDLVERVCALPSVHHSSAVGAISYKDDSTVARFQKHGFARTWRLQAKEDLGIEDAAAGLETVQEALSAAQAERIVARRGQADVLIVRHVLEHAHQTGPFAAALKRLVKPNGCFVFEVPDCRPALERRDYTMPWEEHIVYFTAETFRHSLAALGFSEVHYRCYPYAHENSLTAIVKNRDTGGPSGLSPEVLESQKTLGRGYAGAFPAYRAGVVRVLSESRKSRGKIAVFGAGHLSCFWINALGAARCLEFVLDDHPKKRGLLMPGSRLPIRGSASLMEENIKLCLLSLAPESEAKVLAKNQPFLERGGSFASIFPGKPNSLASN